MRTTRYVLIAAAAATAGFSTFAVVSFQVRGRLERQLASAEQQRLRVLALRSHSDSAGPNVKALTAGAAVAASSSEPKLTQAVSLPPRIRPPGLTDLARNNPELWNEFVRSKRAELGRLYLPVMLRLNLSREEQERVKDILAEDIAHSTDLAAAADAKGLKFTDPEIVALRKQAEQSKADALLRLLSPDRYPEFAAFERAIPLRGFLDGLAVQLLSVSPLSAQQAEELERALRGACPPFLAGKNGNPAEVNWTSVDNRAAQILNPAQLAVWDRHTAHNTLGGSRQSQELDAVYRRPVARMKETGVVR